MINTPVFQQIGDYTEEEKLLTDLRLKQLRQRITRLTHESDRRGGDSRLDLQRYAAEDELKELTRKKETVDE